MKKEKKEQRPPGRMIRTTLSQSHGFSKMSAEARSLFCMMIPHFNAHGKMDGNPHSIKGKVVPLIESLDAEGIERCLREIHDNTSVKWYAVKGIFYLQSVHWNEHQELRKDRLGRDDIPDYSRTTPGPIRHEVEVESPIGAQKTGQWVKGLDQRGSAARA